MKSEERPDVGSEGADRGMAFVLTLFTSVGVWMMSLFIVPQVITLRPDVFVPFVLADFAVCVALTYSYFVYRESRRAQERTKGRRARYAADLAAGQVEEWTVAVVDAFEVQTFDDEGPQFYFSLDDGRVLFVHARGLDIAEGDERLPNRELCITRLPHAGDILHLACRGAYFPASAARESFTEEEEADGLMPEDGQILPGPLSRYVEQARIYLER